jgi:hypothetical protein
MADLAVGETASGRPMKVLYAPYHIYTHCDILVDLTAAMRRRGWTSEVLLPFTSAETLTKMSREAASIKGFGQVHDLTVRRLVTVDGKGALPRLMRALALLVYFCRTLWLLLASRPDALVLTSDLGGVSVRFTQLVAQALGVQIFTLQSTLFLKVAEREDLKFEFRPRWLHKLLSRGLFKKLFLYFGEVPGTFLPGSHVGVQDDEIRSVCMQFGKQAEFIRVIGSLQAARIRASADAAPGKGRAGLPRVLFLSECISERYGDGLGDRMIECMRAAAEDLQGKASCHVRFHPRESDAYREQFMRQLGGICTVDPANTAVEAAASADVVVGAYSMLLFDAQAAGIATVFLDVGEDPLGFYTDKRAPLASSGSELAESILQVLEKRQAFQTAAANPETWVNDILDWISQVVRRAGA